MSVRRGGAALALAALAGAGLGACAGADPTSISGAIQQEKQARKARSIAVPPQPDLARTGRVGLILETNSEGWRKALDVVSGDGAVVVFVLPGSPAALAGVRRGDLVVQVGGTAIRNDERARVGLRGRPGVPLTLRILRREGAVQVKVTPSAPVDVDLVSIYDGLIRAHPKDAAALLLRGEATVDPQEALRFVTRAIDAEQGFVDAYIYRARLFWSESEQVGSDTVAFQDQNRARADWTRALQIDPRSTSTLVSRATALFEVQLFADAERDALHAVSIDPTLATAQLILAEANLSQGKSREAAVPAREAVRLGPYQALAYQVLAATFVALGRREDGVATVRVGLTVAVDENERAALQAVLDRSSG